MSKRTKIILSSFILIALTVVLFIWKNQTKNISPLLFTTRGEDGNKPISHQSDIYSWQINNGQLIGIDITNNQVVYTYNLDSDQWEYFTSLGPLVALRNLDNETFKLINTKQQTENELTSISSLLIYDQSTLIIQEITTDQSAIYLTDFQGQNKTLIEITASQQIIKFLTTNIGIFYYFEPNDASNTNLYKLDMTNKKSTNTGQTGYVFVVSADKKSIYYNKLEYQDSGQSITTTHLLDLSNNHDQILSNILVLNQYLLKNNQLITKTVKNNKYAVVAVTNTNIKQLTDFNFNYIDGFSLNKVGQVIVYSSDGNQTIDLN